MLPTDISHLVSVGRPSLAPDGRTAVIAASRPDLDADDYRSSLWLVGVDGSAAPTRLTYGEHDTAPRYSPDGRWIAFLRTPGGDGPPDDKPQLHLLPTAGGDVRALTALPGGAGAPVWAPDSSRLAFVARVPEPGRYGTAEKITPGKEPPRRITTLQYQRNGVGYLIDRRSQVFVVELPGDDDPAEPRQITDVDADHTAVAWSPDGTELATVADRDHADDSLAADIYVVRPDSSGLRRVTDGSLSLSTVRYSSDGNSLVALGTECGADGRHFFGHQNGLWTVPADATTARPTRLTDAERYNLADAEPVEAGDSLLVLAENRGAVDLLAVPPGGGDPTTLAGGHRMISGVDAVDDSIVVSYQHPESFGELGVVRDGDVRALTDFGGGLPAVRPLEDFTATADDGQQLHGFVVGPDGPGPHPVLLMIHGGPFAQYGWTVFDEAQVYARAGYAVVYTNPRGSSGYGAAYGRWIQHDVGDRSMGDLMTLLDEALRRPDLDAERVGVLGGSHGGFMTTWLVGHTDRFFAAVSERAVNAIDSFVGSSDIGFRFARELWGPPDDASKNPLTYADAITTPLLIVHSEQDWRCPIEQAQRLFVALRSRGADVEMLVFPGENHEMSRSGLPSHRVARFEAILDWFARYLPAAR